MTSTSREMTAARGGAASKYKPAMAKVLEEHTPEAVTERRRKALELRFPGREGPAGRSQHAAEPPTALLLPPTYVVERSRDRDERSRDGAERPRARDERSRARDERSRARDERPRARDERSRDRAERPRDRAERPRARDERSRAGRSLPVRGWSVPATRTNHPVRRTNHPVRGKKQPVPPRFTRGSGCSQQGQEMGRTRGASRSQRARWLAPARRSIVRGALTVVPRAPTRDRNGGVLGGCQVFERGRGRPADRRRGRDGGRGGREGRGRG